MGIRDTKISRLFYRGEHRKVVESTIDSPQPDYSLEDFPFVIGALVYLGRMEEGERLFFLKRESLKPYEQLVCRYFLGVAFCRHSFYAKARQYFFENFGCRHELTDPFSQFFIFQGLGFYHYFAGRMVSALRNSERGLTAALNGHFLYGRALSMDLKGHSLMQTGQVSLGLSTLALADHLALQLEALWLSEAIQVSILSYRSRFGIDSEKIGKELTAKLKTLSKQDVYSQSTLLLDLSEQAIRRGNIAEAKEILNECCRIVYSFQNRRHTALLNLRYAYVHFLEGDNHLALNLVRNTLTQINPEVDVVLELRLRGFERRLVKGLGIEVCEKGLEARIQSLTKRVGETIAKRILDRDHKISLAVANRGEDPIGDLFDEVKRNPTEAIEEILKRGYWGLLPETLPLERGKRILYLDLEPDSLTIFDKGVVEHYPESISRSLKLILLELHKGTKTKEELIESIWKYEYHPVRHDSLIYSAMAKIRKVLGKRSHWIEASEVGYQWRTDVEVKTAARFQRKEVEAAEIETEENPELNLRQQQIIKYVAKNGSIDVSTCLDLFETSEITASRDLSELFKLKMIQRVGKGRGTRYIGLTSPVA